MQVNCSCNTTACGRWSLADPKFEGFITVCFNTVSQLTSVTNTVSHLTFVTAVSSYDCKVIIGTIASPLPKLSGHQAIVRSWIVQVL